MNLPLDNMMWSCLSGPHKHLSSGTDTIRRYARGFSPLVGLADTNHPDLNALNPYCDVGEEFYTEGWTGPAPASWQIVSESTMIRMVWDGALPPADAASDALLLNPPHDVTQAVELVALAKPGPFGVRTIELGDYYGYFDQSRLIAMAGERMRAGSYSEVSAVCTHPDFRGRGMARKLMQRLVRKQMQAGQITFLQVMSGNNAQHLYESMGFKKYREIIVRVIARS